MRRSSFRCCEFNRSSGYWAGSRRREYTVDDAVGRAIDALHSVTTFEAMREIVLRAARATARADGATIVVRDGHKCFYVEEDAIAPRWKGQHFPIEQCISGWAMTHAEVTQVPDIRVDERIPQAAYRPTFVRSLCMVPVGMPDPIGAIGLYWRQVGQRLGDDALAAMQRLAAETERTVRRLGIDSAPWAPNFALDRG
jgi:hypothetical protein